MMPAIHSHYNNLIWMCIYIPTNLLHQISAGKSTIYLLLGNGWDKPCFLEVLAIGVVMYPTCFYSNILIDGWPTSVNTNRQVCYFKKI